MKRNYESVKRQEAREKLQKALKETFGYKLKADDRFSFRHGYADRNIVDVTITRRDGKHATVAAYHKVHGRFPW